MNDNLKQISGAAENAAGYRDRVIGVDIAKILAMFMVVGIHISGFGLPWSQGCEPALNERMIRSCCNAFFASCIDIFAMASGYLGVVTSFKLSRIVRLWIQVVFTGVAVLSVLAMFQCGQVACIDWIKALIPIASRQYWYMTAYFMLFFVMPILNKGIKAMHKRDLRNLIFYILGVICGETIICSSGALGVEDGYSFEWLAVMYVVGAYIRLYNPFAFISNFFLVLMVVLSVMTVMTGVMICNKFVLPLLPVDILQPGFGGYTSPFTVITAICLFLLCLRVEIERRVVRKMISALSGATLGVYLIHMQPVMFNKTIRPVITSIAVNGLQEYLVLLITLTFGIYSACTILDLLRKNLSKGISLLIGKVFTGF